MKKNRKRLVWLLVALCMLLASSGAVYAEGETTISPTTSTAVKAFRTAAKETEELITVEITWPEMVFEYQEGYMSKWNSSTLKYEEVVKSGWKSVSSSEGVKGNQIDVYNKSNVDIQASFSFTKIDSLASVPLEYMFVDATDSENTNKVENGEYSFSLPKVDIDGTSPYVYTAKVLFEITAGELPEEFEQNSQVNPGQIGTITITIE